LIRNKGKTAVACATATATALSRIAKTEPVPRQTAAQAPFAQPRKRRPMSAEHRAKLSAAQLAYIANDPRWADHRAGGGRGSAADDVVVWVGSVGLERRVELPDQLAHMLLGGTAVIGEGVQHVYLPFGMHPAERMAAHDELPGIIAQHRAIARMLPQIARSMAIWTGSAVMVKLVKPSRTGCAC
jgi:hypothetical protein